MPLRLLVQPRLTKIDTLIISLFEKLVKVFRERLVLVESGDFGDFNVRVVLRDRTDEDIDKVLEIARKVEKEHCYENFLLIDILSEEDWKNLDTMPLLPPPYEALSEFIRQLEHVFGDRLILVESGDFGDFNVRVVLRDRTDEDIDKVLEIARKVEEKYQIVARFMIDVISEEEI